MFELSNEQRKFLGLDDIKPGWDRIILKANQYKPETILYFEGDIIRRHILSTEDEYFEKQYAELTQNREFLLPKTPKGKPLKLTVSTLESKTPIGVYFHIDKQDRLNIGNFTTQQTFYSSFWEEKKLEPKDGNDSHTFFKRVNDFINIMPPDHFESMNVFKIAKRKNVKYETGDFFVFRASINEYAFGRILLDINKIRKNKVLHPNHGLNSLMGAPILVKIYAHLAMDKQIDLDLLSQMYSLPSGYMMDNKVFYGEYEIIGNKKLREDEFDFPMSYRNMGRTFQNSFQWGLIHKEMLDNEFAKYLSEINENVPESSPSRILYDPYAKNSIGFFPWTNTTDIRETIKNGGQFDFSASNRYDSQFDLRNPDNKSICDEIMLKFGLDPTKNYIENSKISGTISIQDAIRKIG